MQQETTTSEMHQETLCQSDKTLLNVQVVQISKLTRLARKCTLIDIPMGYQNLSPVSTYPH